MAASTSVKQQLFTGFPNVDAPLVDPATGRIITTSPWYRLFVNLQQIMPLWCLPGAMRNLVIAKTGAQTLAISADFLCVDSQSAAGAPKNIESLSVTFDASTVGPNGMDVGAQPTSGFLSLYAISGPNKPDAVLGTAFSQHTVYDGSALPNGYTRSALIGIWPCAAGPAFQAGAQLDRKFWYDVPVIVATGFTVNAALTEQSVSVAVPLGAKTCDGLFGGTDTTSRNLEVGSSANGLGFQLLSTISISAPGIFGFGEAANFIAAPLATPQNIWIGSNSSFATGRLAVTAFTF